VDGATFKQGLFAPSSGIAVAAPSIEAFAGAGAVLVIAAGYDQEIAKTLRGKLGFAGEVWTLRGHELHRID
jgi:hypothetical protein